jgi:hypothetical protein
MGVRHRNEIRNVSLFVAIVSSVCLRSELVPESLQTVEGRLVMDAWAVGQFDPLPNFQNLYLICRLSSDGSLLCRAPNMLIVMAIFVVFSTGADGVDQRVWPSGHAALLGRLHHSREREHSDFA